MMIIPATAPTIGAAIQARLVLLLPLLLPLEEAVFSGTKELVSDAAEVPVNKADDLDATWVIVTDLTINMIDLPPSVVGVV
jgi:hypothetical protein